MRAHQFSPRECVPVGFDIVERPKVSVYTNVAPCWYTSEGKSTLGIAPVLTANSCWLSNDHSNH